MKQLATFPVVALAVVCSLSSTAPILAADYEYAPIGEIIRHDPALDRLIPTDAKIEVLADGFTWTEGPVWVSEKGDPELLKDVPRTDELFKSKQGPGGYLLFSDIPRNTVFKWKEGEGVSLYLTPSGYTGRTYYGLEPGSNGLVLDPQGRLVLCEHGDRRVSVLTEGGGKLTLADRYQGKRLNSPNDAVYMSNGDLYFTDPPYGLPHREKDHRRELDFFGVYRLSKDGELTLLTKELARPNGIGLSPDEKTLYVAQSDPKKAIWVSFPVKEDGTLGSSKLFYDATDAVGKMPGLPDGMAVDKDGNVWGTGPGGVYVFNPQGKLLGLISTGQRTSNCTFGGADGSELYMTVDMYICRVKTMSKGIGK
jgi:gluconolactonase